MPAVDLETPPKGDSEIANSNTVAGAVPPGQINSDSNKVRPMDSPVHGPHLKKTDNQKRDKQIVDHRINGI